MFHEIENAILERLRAKHDQGTTVVMITEADLVQEMRQKAPAVCVLYEGYNVGDRVAPGTPQLILLNWTVIVGAKSARGNGKADIAREMVSKLAQTTLEALLGFSVGNGKHLRLTDAGGPEYDGGYCFMPLAFTCPATFKGQP